MEKFGTDYFHLYSFCPLDISFVLSLPASKLKKIPGVILAVRRKDMIRFGMIPIFSGQHWSSPTCVKDVHIPCYVAHIPVFTAEQRVQYKDR
jgi:hypothetical protein